MTTASSPARADRFQLRATSRQAAIIRAGAEATHRNVTDFVLDAATSAAARAIAEQRWLVVGAEAYDEFVALLDEPPRDLPGLDELLARPRPEGLDS